ncbi:MAG: hypothetical protein GKR89_28425 [Candidatus Latescibacteria bacterium]|nr:hypothetical protein [Candidatus Latescibacterota bacterium]
MAHLNYIQGLRICTLLLLLSPLLVASTNAQPLFIRDTSETINRAAPFSNRGTTIGDYDNDGRMDVFFSEDQRSGQIALLHNEGGGRFSNQTAALLTPPAGQARGAGMLFGDYDNDGDLDLFVPVWFSDNILLRNDQGLFHPVTTAAGLSNSLATDQATWLDYDRDGYLDLYINDLHQDGIADNRLYRNNGDGTFVDATPKMGLDIPFNNGERDGGMVAADFNDDGWQDLYVGVSNGPNRLFLNDGQGGFVDVTTAEIGDVGGPPGRRPAISTTTATSIYFKPAAAMEAFGRYCCSTAALRAFSTSWKGPACRVCHSAIIPDRYSPISTTTATSTCWSRT